MSAFLLAMVAMGLGANPSDGDVEKFQERSNMVTDPDGTSREMKYRLLVPEKLEPGKKYPVIFFLHGAGERGNDNRLQLKYLPIWMAEPKRRAEFPCFLIAPQCASHEK